MSGETYEYSQDPGKRILPYTSYLAKKPLPDGKYERRYVTSVTGNDVQWFHWNGDGGFCSARTFLRWAGKRVAWYS